MPRDLELGDRAKALEQLGVNRSAHAPIVAVVKDALPETQAGLLVAPRQWPLLAATWARSATKAAPVSSPRTWPGLTADTSWKDGPSSTTAGRLVDATLNCLTTPPPPLPRPRPGPESPRLVAAAREAAGPGS
ncbi:hypothetical protein ABZ743_30045 [Streptomyces sp. NPDC006662]|uniref:hypothetical protein n=1 Tax=Streptomyces sp. NPDC006662 TaxID=3156902 RepID=UPI00340A1DA4